MRFQREYTVLIIVCQTFITYEELAATMTQIGSDTARINDNAASVNQDVIVIADRSSEITLFS